MSRRRPSPRRRGPSADGASVPFAAHEQQEDWGGQEWTVRSITGSSSTKTYRCPGCDHEIRPATPHVVVWPTAEGSQERRHWHTACWKRRGSQVLR